jgi:exodeoxyribonuclease V beta subunit
MPQYHSNFDPSIVDLEDSNLIEASAGTGKTYSIALMAVRLVVQKRMSLEKVLMVTFTNAATAELEDRVRSFIRTALRMARTGMYTGDTLGKLMARYCDTEDRRKDAEALLAKAQLDLDRLQVRTIHGFCQQVMKEYSFETGQVFGAEALSPEAHDAIAADAFHEYWRQRVNVLDEDILAILLGSGLSREDLFDRVMQGVAGKIPAPLDPLPDDFLSVLHQTRLRVGLEALHAKSADLRREICKDLEDNTAVYEGRLRGSAKTAYSIFFPPRNWDGLVDAALKNIGKPTPMNFFDARYATLLELSQTNEHIAKFGKRLISQIACASHQVVEQALKREKEARGVISFDDMILQLANALRVEEDTYGPANHPESLRSRLRARFDAVFIDEFQDTDRDQYYIFHRLFGIEKILFYIGDPKQSIYGWRKADIFTYFKAAANVRHVHRMNVNRRSNAALISAMNLFFKPKPETDTFAYGGSADAIEYVNVESPDQNRKGVLFYDGAPAVPLRISPHPNKRAQRKAFLLIVSDLLRDPRYRIMEEGVPREVRPADIGVLVRSNKEGRAIKEMLASLRIPAVTIDDARLFDSQEARELYHVMVAVQDPTRANINRALLSHIAGYDLDKLRAADEEAILTRFRNYRDTWVNDGVFVMLRRFLADHGIDELFSDTRLANPERTASNILQLTEIVHKVSERRRYDARELLQWLKKGIDGEIRDGDEYQQRIESDEAAVRIVTIHKSKGLEYNIVLAPNLDFLAKRPNDKTISYRDPADSQYYTVETDLMSNDQKDWGELQAEQENRRLLYVAVTRASMACFILASTANNYKKSSLRYLMNQILSVPSQPDLLDPDWGINVDSRIPLPMPAAQAQSVARVYAEAPSFKGNLLQPLWRRTSYSGLSPDHATPPVTRAEGFDSSYDEFVFRTIRRGAHTGNLIHYIMERVDFTRPDFWGNVVDKAIRRLSGRQSEDFTTMMQELIRQVLGTVVDAGTGLRLSDIPWEDRLSELEFDFPLSVFHTEALAAMTTGSDTPFAVKAASLEGIMNGKVDLVFRHGGKYWILDWKSNHLGDRAGDYSVDRVREAMADNNYHLQYHIYTLALRRYLSARLPDFDYDRDFGGCIYLFVRGMRVGADTGIFVHKPEAALLDRMEALTSGRGAA